MAPVSLRAFLEQRLEAMEELLEERRLALEGRLDRETAARQRALELQAREYERRLEALNHAEEQAQAKERAFVGVALFDSRSESLERRLSRLEGSHLEREVFEQTNRTSGVRVDELTARVAAQELARANLDGRLSMLGILWLGASTLVNLLIAFVSHWLR